jgi:catechol 2,3-dioxygenase-like lactoylglutathione lyase family enzyme
VDREVPVSDRGFAAFTDHVAIRVESIERATEFYRKAFGARVLTEPFVVQGELAEGIAGGPAGTRLRMRQIGFDRGVMELFEMDPPAPSGRVPGARSNILHIGVEVDEVAAAMERVVTAGGRIVVPLTCWGEASLCFCTDLDGTLLELADAPIEELLAHTRAAHGG